MVLADGEEIGAQCISSRLGTVPRSPDTETILVPLVGSLKDMERSIIQEVVLRCRGNKAAAARCLRLHRRTLYRLLRPQPRERRSCEVGNLSGLPSRSF